VGCRDRSPLASANVTKREPIALTLQPGRDVTEAARGVKPAAAGVARAPAWRVARRESGSQRRAAAIVQFLHPRRGTCAYIMRAFNSAALGVGRVASSHAVVDQERQARPWEETWKIDGARDNPHEHATKVACGSATLRCFSSIDADDRRARASSV